MDKFKLVYENTDGKQTTVVGNEFTIIEYLLNELKNKK
jgi:hypothetical protein